MVLLMVVMFGFANQDFLNMVEEQTEQGYTWESVERTEVTTETALPSTEDGVDVYYWFLTKPGAK